MGKMKRKLFGATTMEQLAVAGLIIAFIGLMIVVIVLSDP